MFLVWCVFEDIFSVIFGVFGYCGGKMLYLCVLVSYMVLWFGFLVIEFMWEFFSICVNFFSFIWVDCFVVGGIDIELCFGCGYWSGYEVWFLFYDVLVLVCFVEIVRFLGFLVMLYVIVWYLFVYVMGFED